LAGRTTIADILIKFLANVKVSESILALLSGGCVVFGVGQAILQAGSRRLVQQKRPSEALGRALPSSRSQKN